MVMFKGLTFGGINSKDYGVYIEGESAFNAPQRDVELIEIPGRNGAYVHDMGRYSNIEVSYPAGLFGHSESEFAEKISNFRNAICSKKGYQRLTDDYNPDEYRMGVYSSGLDVKPAILRAGEFELKFNCKPQRFLTSGDVPVSLDSGDTLTNPTLFESKPLIECKGYGSIDINGQEIEVTLEPLGHVVIASSKSGSMATALQINLDTSGLVTGDTIELEAGSKLNENALHSYSSLSGATATVSSADDISFTTIVGATWLSMAVTFPSVGFVFGIAKTVNYSFGLDLTKNGTTYSVAYTGAIVYDGASTITVSFSRTIPAGSGLYNAGYPQFGSKPITAESNMTIGNNAVYIDLDIDEAYMIVDDVPVSLNNSVVLGATLPTLKSGVNEITYDNTITNFKITPRWWKL